MSLPGGQIGGPELGSDQQATLAKLLEALEECSATVAKAVSESIRDADNPTELTRKCHSAIFMLHARRDPVWRKQVEHVLNAGWILSDPSSESASIRRSFERTDRVAEFKQFGYSGKSSSGRRMRMELLSACWLISYFLGIRQEVMRSSVLRLSNFSGSIPLGLSYWLVAGGVVDDERFAMSQGLSREPLYICRRSSHLVKHDFRTPEYLSDCPTLTKNLHYLAILYSGLQLAFFSSSCAQFICDDRKKMIFVFSESDLHMIPWWEKAPDTKSSGAFGMQFIIPERFPSVEGVVGTFLGIGSYGKFDMSCPQYGGYYLEKENLIHHRAEVAEILEGKPDLLE